MDRSTFLRRALLGNAAFSTVTALVAGDAVSAWMGLEQAMWVTALGPSLLIFAGVVAFTATRRQVNAQHALLISLADLGWVLASGALLLLTPQAFDSSGRWLVAGVALIVGLCAAAQLIGLARPLRGPLSQAISQPGDR